MATPGIALHWEKRHLPNMATSDKRTAAIEATKIERTAVDKAVTALDGLGDRLRSLIQQSYQGTAAHLARACAIDPPRFTDWLGHGKPPGAANLARLAGGAGISLDWLVLGEGPMFRGQTRTPGELGADVAAHVRRQLAAGGVSAHDLERYLPDSAELLARLVEAGREAVAAGREAAVGRYRAAVARLVDDRDLPDEVRAHAFAFADAAGDPGVPLGPLEWGGGELEAALLLPSLPPGDMCVVVLVARRMDGDMFDDAGALHPARVPTLKLSRAGSAGLPPLDAMRYGAYRATARLQYEEAVRPEQDQEQDVRVDGFTVWAERQEWVGAPDPTHPGFTRWRWVGPPASPASSPAE